MKGWDGGERGRKEGRKAQQLLEERGKKAASAAAAAAPQGGKMKAVMGWVNGACNAR